MTLNLQERHQCLSIPTGWSAPEFQFGQIVRWNASDIVREPYEAWGEIIGLSWWDEHWLYEVLPSSDCPLAIAYPRTWGTGNDIELLSAHRLTLMAG
jgi:hypothetical protein